MNQERFSQGDSVYCVERGRGEFAHIFRATIAGDCCGGKGYEATTDVGFKIHTCNLSIFRTLKEARQRALDGHKKMLEKLKDEQRNLSQNIHYLLWAVANPKLVQVLPHSYGMGEEEIKRWTESSKDE